MEDELKCPSCSRLFCKPLLLPCSHSVCMACASKLQEPANLITPQTSEEGSNPQTINELDCPDLDKLSILSETDSGVVCNSRPNSYVGTPSIGNLYLHSIQGIVYGLKCPVCKRPVFLDENGVQSLPQNTVLENIIHKYSENKPVTIKCQLCEKESNEATVMCEQCEVFYCDTCRDSCHPSRGPLVKHNLVDPAQGKALLRAKNKRKEVRCPEHADEHLSMFCVMCRMPVCYICAQDGQHINHEVQALGAMCKSQKNELSQSLQALSEKARAGTEFIHRLKGMVERVEGNCTEFREGIVAQCDSLVDAIKRRKQELLDSISEEKEVKLRILKEQVQDCTALLQRTTGLLQFSIEVLKESDAMSYLQVSAPLVSRVAGVDQNFNKDMELAPRVSPEFELTLDNSAILHAITNLNFFQMKAPGQPMILPEDCCSENNSVTIAWRPYSGSVVEAFTLELDDGNNGDFRVVYVGREVICTVDGLHFNSIYNARVKAHNHAGEGPYSDPISLQTAEVAWFTFDPLAAHSDLLFSNDNQTVTCNSYEPRVVMGGVGFSKGVHYWEVSIDHYDNHSDPAFGIARFDVSKNLLLGKDDKAWSMYVDYQRSWFIHRDEHSNRTDGGIQQGSIVGILLDLNKHRLSYFINDEPHGPIAFHNLHGVFFPAISINRNVQVTLRTGLEPPMESESDEDE